MLFAFRFLSIAVVTLVLTAPAWAGESEDAQKVRALLYKEQDSVMEGDQERLLSCYAPDFVGYLAGGEGPELWQVGIVGLDSLRSLYAAKTTDNPSWLKRHPEVRYLNEVLHISIKDDRAIALTQHWSSLPDTTARETLNGMHQSVWMLAKVKGEWKIRAFVKCCGWRVSVSCMVKPHFSVRHRRIPSRR
jgi:hypothetical protein